MWHATPSLTWLSVPAPKCLTIYSSAPISKPLMILSSSLLTVV
jgi:hypothetical protein